MPFTFRKIKLPAFLDLLPLFLLAGVIGFFFYFHALKNPQNHTTLEQIIQSGEITVITRNNAHCYYLYEGQPMGFEYDLAKAFADYLGVRLNIRIVDTWDQLIPALESGAGAFIAASMTKTPEREKSVSFSTSYLSIRQHIITHRDDKTIRSLSDLDDAVIHIQKGTTYKSAVERMKRNGINAKLVEHHLPSTENLIAMTASGKIETTIADSNIALLNRRYYPQIRIGMPVSQKEKLAWAVHPKARKLRFRINSFFREIKANGVFDEIYNRYYEDIDNFDYVELIKYHIRLKTRLPKYKKFIKTAADKYNFDWRLIAAQMYQESHMNPWAKSHSGAYGLMQLLPSTARSLGVQNIFDPEENIIAGTRQLKKLYDFFDRAKGHNRLAIALATYNVGQGHMLDARNIARKRGEDPNEWRVISKTLPLLRKKKYYKDSIYGYCRGDEPVKYVQNIMMYYDILRRKSLSFNQGELNRFLDG